MDVEELQIVPEPDEDEVYVQYDIASYPSDYTLGGIYDLFKSGDIVIPDFQREFVWTVKQSSLLIESFLVGLPVPPAFFYIDDTNKSLVIDGQQRILSVVYFFDGSFESPSAPGKRNAFRLKGLDEKSPYHNLRFADLKESDQRKLKNSVLRAVNIRQLSPSAESTSVYHIFERLNTGGTALKAQEIRNCVYRGEIVSALREMNKEPSWRKLLGKQGVDKHQRDVELVLRLFALFREWEYYEKPMKEYLTKAMKDDTKFSSAKAKVFPELFAKSCKAILGSLGEKPFGIRGPLNTSVLDAVMVTVIENSGNIAPDFKKRFESLVQDELFQSRTRLGTTDTSVVHDRLLAAKKHLVG